MKVILSIGDFRVGRSGDAIEDPVAADSALRLRRRAAVDGCGELDDGDEDALILAYGFDGAVRSTDRLHQQVPMVRGASLCRVGRPRGLRGRWGVPGWVVDTSAAMRYVTEIAADGCEVAVAPVVFLVAVTVNVYVPAGVALTFSVVLLPDTVGVPSRGASVPVVPVVLVTL